jgi:hypothetical protein
MESERLRMRKEVVVAGLLYCLGLSSERPPSPNDIMPQHEFEQAMASQRAELDRLAKENRRQRGVYKHTKIPLEWM